jgi:hypothetical protein
VTVITDARKFQYTMIWHKIKELRGNRILSISMFILHKAVCEITPAIQLYIAATSQ